ncbi:MAG: hypothetical protein K2N54_02800, partial [Helicobacter sp.]|nr:hypothetical protein [Helicobacter sp.]
PCKLEWSKEEKEMRAKEKEHLNNVAAYQNNVIDTLVPKLVEDLKQKIQAHSYDFVFDLNEVIKNSQEPLFTNHWIHCNAHGNALCAQYVAQVLRQKEWL